MTHGMCFSGVSCAAETVNNIIWEATTAGSTATGTCVMGYGASSQPSRPCQSNGVWGTVLGACIRAQFPLFHVCTCSL